jgi:hypothetical protein
MSAVPPVAGLEATAIPAVDQGLRTILVNSGTERVSPGQSACRTDTYRWLRSTSHGLLENASSSVHDPISEPQEIMYGTTGLPFAGI